jgi:hypothetical protein
MRSRPYDVVLLPEAVISQKALKVSKIFEPRGVLFTLDEKSFFSHLSLYMLQLDGTGVKTVSERLAVLASDEKVIAIDAISYNYEKEYIDVEYYRTPELVTLQNKVVELLNPIRDGLREKDQERLNSVTGEELQNILLYGYRSIGNQFNPHLTFSRFILEQKEIINELPDKTTFSGKYEYLALFEMGENGTCTKLVNSWKLK